LRHATLRRPPVLRLLLVGLPALAVPVAGTAQGTEPGAGAFADEGARHIVQEARARRALLDTRIRRYQVDVTDRFSARARLAGVERLVLRRETVSRVDWSPDTVRVEVLGAREVQPMARAEVGLPPSSMAGMVPALAFDPVDSEMLLRIDSTLVLHPLAPGSEAYYRFSSGDTTTIRLPDDREIRLLELRIRARSVDPRLLNGSFWVDAEGFAVVRAGFRLTAPRSASASSVSFLAPEVTTEVEHVVIEYGLWEMAWWLPRSLVAEGTVQAGPVRFPLTYERRYGAYEVEGDTARLAAPVDPEAAGADRLARPCRPVLTGSVVLGPGGAAGASDAWDQGWDRAAERLAGDSVGVARGDGCDRVFLVDRAEGDLSASPAFTWNVFESEAGPLDAGTREAIRALTREIPGGPWRAAAPRVQLLPLEALRYNRVEGLSSEVRATLPLGPGAGRAALRFGTGGRLDGSASLEFRTARARWETGLYRRIEASAPGDQPFSLPASLEALLAGRDEHDYHRATGLELGVVPAGATLGRWEATLFAERQAPVSEVRSPSLRSALDSDFLLRPNADADRIDQVGIVLLLRGGDRNNPAGRGLVRSLEVHAETGDRSFVRPLARLRAQLPVDRLGSRLRLHALAGAATGDPPIQRQWRLGGAGTVRGHDPASLQGDALLLGRAELLRGTPARSLVMFGDLGWTGDASELDRARPLRGVGAGISWFDDSFRIELAHGLGAGTTRLYLRYAARR
jgi:hypothetical protein